MLLDSEEMVLNSYQDLVSYWEQNMDAKLILFNREKLNFSFIGAVIEKENKKVVCVDNGFFHQYQNEFKNFLCKKIMGLNSNVPATLRIPNMLVTEELIDFLVDSKELSETKVYFYGLANENIDEKLVKKLQASKKYIVLNGKLISTNMCLRGLTYKQMVETNDIYFFVDQLNDSEIEKFKYFGENAKIALIPFQNKYESNYIGKYISAESYDERQYLQKIALVLSKLSKHGRMYNVLIYVNNQELLRQSGILEIGNLNINLLCGHIYESSREEYNFEQEQLEKLVKPIKEANLSPFEKYLAVYNIVKQFKQYKENPDDKDKSRYLKYILNNEYIVCKGFTELLKALLDKVGISSIQVDVHVDDSYIDGFTLEDKVTEMSGHARNIVKIDDDKYNIHGLFIADATWDNDLEVDLYNNAAITFDKKKEAIDLEELVIEDLLLDFHSIDEFMEKLSFLIKRGKNSFKNGKSLKNEQVFYEIYLKICEILRQLDYPKYDELFKKYNQNMELMLNDGKEETSRQTFIDFVIEYVQYILPLVNHEISRETLLMAAKTVKKQVNKYDDEMLEKWYQDTKKDMDLDEELLFPYVYDSENPRINYLESKELDSKKR